MYEELDETLRENFADYVLSLGIDGDFAANAFDLADNKERLEYVHWLEGVKTFLK